MTEHYRVRGVVRIEKTLSCTVTVDRIVEANCTNEASDKAFDAALEDGEFDDIDMFDAEEVGMPEADWRCAPTIEIVEPPKPSLLWLMQHCS
jgi:hypothetical protein